MVVLGERDELDTETDKKTPTHGAVKTRCGDFATHDSPYELHVGHSPLRSAIDCSHQKILLAGKGQLEWRHHPGES
jgi:hypothetical protein